jgi:hypothetical protein
MIPHNVSNIPDSIADWMPLIERRFQPQLNRRSGAVVLFKRVNQLHNANMYEIECAHLIRVLDLSGGKSEENR